MKSTNLSSFQIAYRVMIALVVTHFAYYFLFTILVNSANDGLEGLLFVPLIIIACIGLLIFLVKKLTNLSVLTIIFGVVIAITVLFLIETLLHPDLFSGDGSTLVSPNLFVPALIWDNNFEYLRIFPAAYIISVVFNYFLVAMSILISDKILTRR